MSHISHFYSDPHFSHRNIISYCDRPFTSISHMNDALIENYNAVVGKNDVVLWLGDCFFMSAELAYNVLCQLNGTKLLVRGNHDKSAPAMAKLGFAVVADSMTLHIAGRNVLANHYPYRSGALDERQLPYPPRDKHQQVLLHGHTHSKKILDGNMVHLGVDAWNYAPASYEDVEILVGSIK